jgi:hypothetical protein
LGEVYKYRNRCPNVIWLAREGNNLLGELMEGGGPMGGFLYEVGEMKGNLQMGKWIVDKMEGSCYCGGAVQK